MYALKSLNTNLSLGRKEIKKFIRELKILNDINHNNIIKLYGVSRFSQTDNLVMVLQFANDGNLRNYLKGKWKDGKFKISWTKVIEFAIKITDGLNYLHENGIIHRDLHSNNILINGYEILIADFGISKEIDNNSISSSQVQGMPAYVDPRYFNGNFKPDKKIDIYSLGVLLWELTSGIPPFHQLIPTVIIRKIWEGNRENPIANTPSYYVKLFKKCCSSNPYSRPTTKEILITLNILAKLDRQSTTVKNYCNKNVVRSRIRNNFNNKRCAVFLGILMMLFIIVRNIMFALKIREETYQKIEGLEDALVDLNKLLEIDPNNAFALRNRASAYQMMGRYNEALEDLNILLEIKPNGVNALKIRGEIYRDLKRYKDALRDLNKSLEIDPQDAFALKVRSAIYRSMGKYKEALTDLIKFFEIANSSFTKFWYIIFILISYCLSNFHAQ
ncbi:kinase-like domain-containing protein [Gigaspora rosea]|uniref:Kinase-like domain-containing protein n=1 Tax=Gigaspora rosea TaxID=44941 RepID=A0A397VGP0_9GLOM|nr:kinase-like domain-containing protein [Gigaspora rosea]